MAIKQRADSAVGHDRDFAALCFSDLLHRSHNAALRIYGALPAANRFFRRAKELISNALEFIRRQEAGGRPVVLAQGLDLVKAKREVLREDGGAVDRLLLGAAIDGGDVPHPWLAQSGAHALFSQLRERPARHRHVAGHHDVRMADEVQSYLSRAASRAMPTKSSATASITIPMIKSTSRDSRSARYGV